VTYYSGHFLATKFRPAIHNSVSYIQKLEPGIDLPPILLQRIAANTYTVYVHHQPYYYLRLDYTIASHHLIV